MKCEKVQSQLLNLENPAQVPCDLRAHLACCFSCRNWQDQLVQLERHVPYLPIPQSRRKADFLHQLLHEPEEENSPEMSPAPIAEESSPQSRERTCFRAFPLPRAYASAASRLAGVILVLVFLGIVGRVWLQVPPPETSPRSTPEPFLATLVQRDLLLATAATPRERIDILVDLAGDLEQESQMLRQAEGGEAAAAALQLQEQKVRDYLWEAQRLTPRSLRPAPQGAPRPEMAARLEQWQRDGRLVERLVQDALRLAREDDPLQRAACCGELGQALSDGLTPGQDAARLREMGEYVCAVCQKGVAVNLQKQGERREKLAREIQKGVVQLLGLLEEQVRRQGEKADPAEMEPILQLLRDARKEIDNALPKDAGSP
jgi:hypothetical protein